MTLYKLQSYSTEGFQHDPLSWDSKFLAKDKKWNARQTLRKNICVIWHRGNRFYMKCNSCYELVHSRVFDANVLCAQVRQAFLGSTTMPSLSTNNRVEEAITHRSSLRKRPHYWIWVKASAAAINSASTVEQATQVRFVAPQITEVPIACMV
jgi:hypothetical protein